MCTVEVFLTDADACSANKVLSDQRIDRWEKNFSSSTFDVNMIELHIAEVNRGYTKKNSWIARRTRDWCLGINQFWTEEFHREMIDELIFHFYDFQMSSVVSHYQACHACWEQVFN